MGKSIFLVFLIVGFTCSFTACSKSSDDNESNNVNKIISSKGDGTNLIPESLTDTLTTFMPVNKGQTPPNVEGMYRFNTLTVLSIAGGNGQIKSEGSINVSSDFFKYFYNSLLSASETGDSIDHTDSYIYFRFSSQNNKQHAIYLACTIGGSYENNGVIHHNAAYDTLHIKASIQGADNKFTTYYTYTYTSPSSSRTYKLGLVISGEKTDNGIANLRACICAVNEINCLELYYDLYNDFKESGDTSLDDDSYYQKLVTISNTLKGIETIKIGNHIFAGDLNSSIEKTSWPTETIPLPWKDTKAIKLAHSEKKASLIMYGAKVFSNLKKSKAIISKDFNKKMITIRKKQDQNNL